MSDLRPLPRARAVPWLALFGMIGLVLAGISMAIYEEQLLQSERYREVLGQAEILAASMTAALTFDDRKAVQEYVDPMRVNSDLEAVGVYDKSGKLVTGFFAGRPLPSGLSSDESHPQRGRLIVAVPVKQQNASIGTIYIRAIAEPIRARVLRYSVLALLVIMAALILGVLVSSQVSLTRANRILGRQTRELAEANERLQSEMAERERVEAALRQSQKMEAIGQLSGGIAHDFNNLLMIIKGNLHFLQRKRERDPAAAARHIEAAIEGVNRAATLTQRVLAFSRKQSLSPVEVDLNQLIAGMHDLLRNSTGENTDIVQDLHANWEVKCDANQMENVILNLVINARDAMPDGGRIIIATQNEQVNAADGRDVPAGDYVKLTVRDDGCGMPEDVRSRAFDPFFTTKPPGQGTGLGLSTAFGFVEQSGGYMNIDTAPGEGTTITILLPRDTEAARSAEARA